MSFINIKIEFKAKTENSQFVLSFNLGENEKIIKHLKAKYGTEKDCTYISMSFDPQKRDLTAVEFKS